MLSLGKTSPILLFYAIAVSIAVSPALADRILQAFSQLAGRQYTVAQVNIALQEQERHCNH